MAFCIVLSAKELLVCFAAANLNDANLLQTETAKSTNAYTAESNFLISKMFSLHSWETPVKQ